MVGPYQSAASSDAVDAVKRRPSAPAVNLPAPNSPSCPRTSRLLTAADRRLCDAFMCAFLRAVFVFDGGEGGGVSEPAPMRVPSEA